MDVDHQSISPVPSPPVDAAALAGTLTRPARHGVVLDFSLSDGRRVHVRMFTFAKGEVNGVPTDLPADLPLPEAEVLLVMARQRMWPQLEGEVTLEYEALSRKSPELMALRKLLTEEQFKAGLEAFKESQKGARS